MSVVRSVRAIAPGQREAPLGVAATLWGLTVAVLLALFFDTARSLVSVWSSSVIYGHGFLILPICAYLVHQRWPRAAVQPVRPWPLVGGLLLLAAGGVWLVGALTSTGLLQHLGLVGMLQSSVVLVLGGRIAAALVFPLGYLILAVPFGDSFIPYLQDVTAVYTTALLRVTGIPVYLENWQMITPDGVFLVAEVCAGLQYVLACLAVGVLIAGLLFQSWWKRALVMLSAAAVSVTANVVRAYGIVMLAHVAGIEAADGVAHVFYGFIFLSLVMAGLIALAFALRERESGAPSWRKDSPPQGTESARRAGRLLPRAGVAVAVVLAVGLGLRAGEAALTRPPMAAENLALVPPEVGPEWTRLSQPPVWTPKFEGKPVSGSWAYAGGGDQVALALAYYPRETQGSEVARSRPFFVSDHETSILNRQRGTVPTVAQLAPPATLRLSDARGNATRLVWYWYWVDGRLTHAPAEAKLYRLLAKLTGGREGAALIVLSTPENENAAETLARFAGDASLTGLVERSVRSAAVGGTASRNAPRDE